MPEERELVSILIVRLGTISEMEAVVLGGSQARGRAEPEVNIDLGSVYHLATVRKTIHQEEIAYLFAYGTLQDEAVQLATFGRKLAGQADALVGYRLVMVEVKDQGFVASSGSAQQRSLQHTGEASDFVEGTVFRVTRQELEQADEYEPVDYHRVLVALRSGGRAWVYVQKG